MLLYCFELVFFFRLAFLQFSNHSGSEVDSLLWLFQHIDSYSTTKAEGEALVIKSNGVNGLLTCCLRPSGIFGPGDKLFVPSLVSAARAGKFKFIIGDGNNTHDFTYVENVAHAHVCAERALASGGETAKKAAGQAFFVTNMEPISNFGSLSHKLLRVLAIRGQE
ncbi:hypothetical protein SLE2022_147720 [Rubroshorea leprosula]